MKKDIPVRIACGNEAIAFFWIKKFYDSGFHERVSNSQICSLNMPFFKITVKNSKIKKFPQIRSSWDFLNRNQKTFVNGDPMVFF